MTAWRRPPHDTTSAGLAFLVSSLHPDGPVAGMRGDGTIVSTSIAEIERGVGPDGIGALLRSPGQRTRAARLARQRGLSPAGAFAYRAGPAGGEAVLLNLSGAAVREVVSARGRPTQHRALLSHAAGWPPSCLLLSEALRDVALLLRRSSASPVAAWLSEAASDATVPMSIRASGPDATRTFVIRLRTAGRQGVAVAKVRTGPEGRVRLLAEARMIARMGADAEAAGAMVPRAVVRQSPAGSLAIVAPEIRGARCSTLIHHDPDCARLVLLRLASWLGDWGSRTASPRVLSLPELERILLVPAAALSLTPSHVARLRRLCIRVAGCTVPMVATHGDLTVYNVLLQPGGGLGVVDWECAEPRGLPMTDFWYAAVDIMRAARPDGDRIAAFANALGERSPLARLANRLGHVLAAQLELTPDVVEMSRQACWLRHAADEVRQDHSPDDRPFATIARMAAAHTDA